MFLEHVTRHSPLLMGLKGSTVPWEAGRVALWVLAGEASTD